MRRTSGQATRGDPGGVSSILRVLADTPPAALEEELLRLEHEHMAGADHRGADYLAVVRVRELAERRRRREQEISILYSTARLTALRGVDEALESIVRSAHDLVDTDLTYLTVFEENGTRLRVRATAGSISPDFRVNFHAPADVGISGRVAGTWAPYYVRDYLASTEIVHHPDVDRPITAEGIVSMLGVPLIAGDRFLGTLIAAMRQERVFAAEDVALLTAFGHHAAVALENSRLYDESRRALQELRQAYATIEAAVAVHEALTRMVLAGGDVGDVADLLVDALGGSVLVLDRTDRVIAAHGLPADDDEAAVRTQAALSAVPSLATSLGRAIQESRQSGRCATVLSGGTTHRHIVAIAAASTYLGALVLSRDGRLKPVDVRTLEHAAQIAALLTLAQRAVVDAEERVRGELLTELMTADRPFAAELQLRARARNVEPNGLDVVLVVDGAGNRRGDVTRLLHDVLSPHAGLAGEHLGVPTALLGTDDVETTAERVHRRLRQMLQIPLLVCATSASPGPDPLASGFTMATRCCAVLRELGVDDGHTTTADLSIYTILFDPAKGGTLQAFLDRSLGRLINHDLHRGTDLMGTLTAYFANAGNFAKTARALHIHTNTLTKRIDRISNLLGTDWQKPDVALNLQLAVRLHGLAQRVGALTAWSSHLTALRGGQHLDDDRVTAGQGIVEHLDEVLGRAHRGRLHPVALGDLDEVDAGHVETRRLPRIENLGEPAQRAVSAVLEDHDDDGHPVAGGRPQCGNAIVRRAVADQADYPAVGVRELRTDRGGQPEAKAAGRREVVSALVSEVHLSPEGCRGGRRLLDVDRIGRGVRTQRRE